MPDLTFSIGPLTLAQGLNSFDLQAIDNAGNTGHLAFTLTLDTAMPGALAAASVSVVEQSPGLQAVSGAPGCVPSPSAGLQVIVRALTTNATVSAAVAADGSFSAAIPALAGDTLRLTARSPGGNEGPAIDVAAAGTVPIPPDPASVAPPLDPTSSHDTCSLVSFFWTGASRIQYGVAAGAIDCSRVAVVHGRVTDAAGAPLAGVRVSAFNQPGVGFTLTRNDGAFDLALHGANRVVLVYTKAGYLAVQRPLPLAYGQFGAAPDVALVAPDSAVTSVDLTTAGIQMARGSVVTDAGGTRRATLLWKPGTTALIRLPGGATQPLTSLQVRATELSAGALASQSLPAPLAPEMGHGYVVDLSVDAGVAANAPSVEFGQPVVVL